MTSQHLVTTACLGAPVVIVTPGALATWFALRAAAADAPTEPARGGTAMVLPPPPFALRQGGPSRGALKARA